MVADWIHAHYSIVYCRHQSSVVQHSWQFLRIKMLTLLLKYAVLTVGVLAPVSVYCQIKPPVPISVPSPGFFLGSGTPAAKIVIEAFLDINCPDSAAIWEDIQKVASHYPTDKVAVKVLWCPLPYHRNTMLSTQGYHAISSHEPKMVIPYITTVFKHVSEWSTAATVNMTEPQVIQKLAMYTEQATGIPASTFAGWLAQYRNDVISEWKLAVRRTVGGTPWYFVNGVDVGNGQNTYDVWVKFLDGMLMNTGKTSVKKAPLGTAEVIARYLEHAKKQN